MQASAMLALKECLAFKLIQAVMFGRVGKRLCDGTQFLELQRQVILDNHLVDSRFCVAGTHYFFRRASDRLR